MRILVIRLSSLGDVILTTPVVCAIKKKFPDSKITYLVKEEYKDILRNNPHIHKILSLSNEDRSIIKIISLALKLKKEYDIVIDLHLNFRSFIITLFSRARVYKYRKNIFKRWILVLYSYARAVLFLLPEIFKGEDDNVVKNYFYALMKLDIKYNNELPEVFIVPQNNLRDAIGISPGGKWFTKRWLPERFFEIVYHISKKHRIFMFGDEKDKALIHRIKNSVSNKIVDYSGMTSIPELVSLISQCRILITNDSAPMHIAVALKVPVIALFCSTTPKFGFAPGGNNNKIINYDVSCKPCNLHGRNFCWRISFDCARKIQALEVISAVDELLI